MKKIEKQFIKYWKEYLLRVKKGKKNRRRDKGQEVENLEELDE